MNSIPKPSRIGALAMLCLLIFFTHGAYATNEDLHLAIEEGRFTLQAKNIPLKRVLQKLEKKGALKIHGRLQENPQINLDIKGLSLPQTLAAIRRESAFGYALRHVQGAPPVLWLFSGQGTPPALVASPLDSSEAVPSKVAVKKAANPKPPPSPEKPQPKPDPIRFNLDPTSFLPSP